MALELVGGPHKRELVLALWGQGGGGTTKLYQHCGATGLEHIGADRAVFPVSVSMAVGLLQDHGLRCATAGPLRTAFPHFDGEPIPPGDYELRLRAHGVPDYNPPTRIRVLLKRLAAHGLTPLPVQPDAAAVARRALYRGEIPLEGAREDAAWWALAAGDAPALRLALAERWRAGDRRRLRWLLRMHGDAVVPELEQLLGRGFSQLFYEAYREAGEPVKRTPAVERALLRPALSSLPLTEPSSAVLWLWRAQIRHRRGERARARRLARAVLQHTDDPELRSGAERLLPTRD